MKGKKIAIGLIAAACAFGGAFALFGCSKTEEHVHDYETEFTPIMKNDGTSEYHAHKCKDETCSSVSGSEKHVFGEGTINEASTCTKAGRITYTCTKCEYSFGEDLPLAAHTWGGWTVVAPTQTEEGKATRVCTATGCGAEDTPLIIPTLAAGEFTTEIKEASTCTTDGITKYTYTNGNESVSFNVTVPKGHKYKAVFDKTDPMAFTAVVTCENCSKVSASYSKGNGLIMTHEQVNPTCQNEGYSKWTGTLTHDGVTLSDSQTTVIPKVEHNFTKWAYDETNHWKVCSYKGCTQKDVTSDEAHSYSPSEVTKHPTATTQGERQQKCECGHTNTVKFDGVANTCEITSLYTVETNVQGVEVSRTPLNLSDGKYWYLRDDKAVYLSFDKAIESIDLYYSTDGENYSAVPAPSMDNTDPAVYSFNRESGACFIRLYSMTEIRFKANIYVTEDSIAAEKQFIIAPVPVLETPKAYVYNEGNFAYEWADIADTTIYVGQEYKIKALGYNVTAGGQGVTLNAQGEGTFTPAAAGDYTVNIVSPYNTNDSYTAKITVKEAPDTAKLLSGSFTGGDYTVTFGESNAITVSKEGDNDIPLTYTYEGGVFATAGSDSVSIILTPAYRLFIDVNGTKTELTKTGTTANEIFEILGGTVWKITESTNEYTVTFNDDGTGTIEKHDLAFVEWGMDGRTTFNFAYSCTVIDNIYHLAFERQGEGVVDAVNGGAGFNEIGAGATNMDKDNDFSYINNGSTVSGDGTSLSLNFSTGIKAFEKQG